MTAYTQVISMLEKLLIILSGVVALTGSATNALSLSYFMRKVEKTLSNKIFIMLNASDLLVSLFDVAIVAFHFCGKSNSMCGKNNPGFRVALLVMEVALESTAFATCLLTVTRTISLCYPFYQINKKGVQIASLIFLIQEILRSIVRFYFYYISASRTYYYVDNGIRIASILIIIFVNLVSSILSARKLLSKRKQLGIAPVYDDNQGPRTNTNQKATSTILIISILFCFFNIVYCIALYFTVKHSKAMFDKLPLALKIVHGFSLWLALPLNSAINPIIYFIRKKDMREYIKDLLPSVF